MIFFIYLYILNEIVLLVKKTQTHKHTKDKKLLYKR